ncbi:MAG: DUF4870 domain-containing protein [Patescibacteria group bacterium]
MSDTQSSQTPSTEAPKVVPVFDKKDIDDNKVIAAIGYIGILCLIPLLAKKDSKFAQEHGRQAFVLFIGEIVVWVLGMLPVIGWFLIGPLGSLLLLVVSIIAIIKTLQGEFWEIPVIGKYRKSINL